jgi:hypothetical protein
MNFELLQSQLIQISKLKNNDGQIPDVPKNPRFIKDTRFEKLVKSLQDNPEMLSARELLVYQYENQFIVIGGNMRLRAAKELGYKELPCKVLTDLTSEQIRAIVIKDNISFGSDDWESLSNEWDSLELEEWGMEVPNFVNTLEINQMTENELDFTEEFDPIGESKGLVRLVVIFDGMIEAKDWIDKNVPELEYKKKGNDDNIILQVNLATNYGI